VPSSEVTACSAYDDADEFLVACKRTITRTASRAILNDRNVLLTMACVAFGEDFLSTHQTAMVVATTISQIVISVLAANYIRQSSIQILV
jgi:hypothetical protein